MNMGPDSTDLTQKLVTLGRNFKVGEDALAVTVQTAEYSVRLSDIHGLIPSYNEFINFPSNRLTNQEC